MENFTAIKISDRVYWVGAIDWALRNFHGYQAEAGSTYNAFLILGEEPILVDTVKEAFFDEMVSRIRSVIDPKKIVHLISNHSEMDHSGALLKAMALISPKQILASKMGHQGLRAHFHFDEKITEITQGEQMTLGDTQLTFLETRMLHWPDSMFTFVHNDGVLFSQDAFGMHLATSQLFADKHDRYILRKEAGSYYANILMPYAKLVSKLLSSPLLDKLDIKLIAPDHGPLWRNSKDVQWILDLYKQWSVPRYYQKAVIVYDTMWQSTAKMASVIADGVMSEGVEVKLLPMSGSYRSDIADELLEAGAFLVGTPTLNKQMFPTIADMLCYIKGLEPKSLLAQAFGSYGWNADGASQVQTILKEMGLTMVNDEPLNVQYVPQEKDLELCHKIGQTVAKRLIDMKSGNAI